MAPVPGAGEPSDQTILKHITRTNSRLNNESQETAKTPEYAARCVTLYERQPRPLDEMEEHDLGSALRNGARSQAQG